MTTKDCMATTNFDNLSSNSSFVDYVTTGLYFTVTVLHNLTATRMGIFHALWLPFTYVVNITLP